jgi:hypothetical protein
MSSKKLNLTFSSFQKSKFVNKCIQFAGLSKKFKLPCKQNQQGKNVNYEYFSYEAVCNQNSTTIKEQDSLYFLTNTNTSVISNDLIEMSCSTQRPISSTMIQSNHSHASSIESFSSHSMSQITPSHNELQEVCKSSCSFFFETTYQSNNEEETLQLIRHQSPLNTLYVSNNDYDFLQSTKIQSNIPYDKLKCEQTSIIQPPVSASTFYASSYNHSNLELDDLIVSQIQAFETIIEGLSTTIHEQSEDETHICTVGYVAQFVDDVSVQFADTVKILKDDPNNDWLFVRVASDGRKGFVPKNILMELNDFIKQLKDQHSELISKSSNYSNN